MENTKSLEVLLSNSVGGNRRITDIIRYILVIFLICTSVVYSTETNRLLNRADVGISVQCENSKLLIQGIHSQSKELDVSLSNLSSSSSNDILSTTAHFNIRRLEKHLLLKYSNSAFKEQFALLIDFSGNITFTRSEDTYTGYKEWHKYAIKTNGNITNRHSLTFYDLMLSANHIYNYGTLRSRNWQSFQNYFLNTGMINMGININETIDVDLSNGYEPELEQFTQSTQKLIGTVDNYGTWTCDGTLDVKLGININNYGACSFENLNMSGGMLSSKKPNKEPRAEPEGNKIKEVHIHGSLSGKVAGVDIGSGNAVKVNNCDIKDVDILNVDKDGEFYSSGGLNLTVNKAYYNEGVIASSSDINLNINSIFPRVNGGVVIARKRANVSFSTPSKRNRKISKNTTGRNRQTGNSFSLNGALADINSQRLKDLIRAVFSAKGEVDLGGDGEHIGAGRVAGNRGKLRIRTDHYLNTITHITTEHWVVDQRTGSKYLSHTTYDTEETGYVFKGSTYSEQDIPAPNNQDEYNKAFDNEQTRMAEFKQLGKALGSGLVDVLRVASANSKYRSLINQLREELAKAGLSKEQIDALLNCKNYQDALRFYNSLAQFRTREDGSEGLNVDITNFAGEDEFKSELSEYYDKLTEWYQRLDSATGSFFSNIVVPCVMVSPYARTVAGGARVAVGTYQAIQKVAIAAGLSAELLALTISIARNITMVVIIETMVVVVVVVVPMHRTLIGNIRGETIGTSYSIIRQELRMLEFLVRKLVKYWED